MIMCGKVMMSKHRLTKDKFYNDNSIRYLDTFGDLWCGSKQLTTSYSCPMDLGDLWEDEDDVG